MASARPHHSDLEQAAHALESSLRDLERLTESLSRVTLHSRAHIERTAKQLEAVSELDTVLNERVQALVAAVQAARARRLEQASRITEAAQVLQERTETWRQLMERFAHLGAEASGLNLRAVELLQAPRPEGVAQVAERMEALAHEAGELATDGAEAGFEDVRQQADAVRQQLLSARNKLRLAAGEEAAGPPGQA